MGNKKKREGSERTGNGMQESGQAYKNEPVVCLAPNFYWSVCTVALVVHAYSVSGKEKKKKKDEKKVEGMYERGRGVRTKDTNGENQ